jgi:hypothetical protein
MEDGVTNQSKPEQSRINLTMAIPWVLTLLTVLVGIYQFGVQQRQTNRTSFLNKQLDTVFDAATTASLLAVETDPTKWDAARQTFWNLYWGTLSIVENKDVEREIVSFGKLVPSEPVSQVQLPVDTLRGPSYHLAKAFRDLILKSWHVDDLGILLDARETALLKSHGEHGKGG